MKVKEYVALFNEQVNAKWYDENDKSLLFDIQNKVLLEMYFKFQNEQVEMMEKRHISTHHGLVNIIKELDLKWQLFMKEINMKGCDDIFLGFLNSTVPITKEILLKHSQPLYDRLEKYEFKKLKQD